MNSKLMSYSVSIVKCILVSKMMNMKLMTDSVSLVKCIDTGSNEGIKLAKTWKNSKQSETIFFLVFGVWLNTKKKATMNPTATNPFFGPPNIGGGGKTGKNTNFFISSPIFLILVSFCSSLKDKKLLLQWFFSEIDFWPPSEQKTWKSGKMAKSR